MYNNLPLCQSIFGYNRFPYFTCCVIFTSECSVVIDPPLSQTGQILSPESRCAITPGSWRSESSEYRPAVSGTLQVAFKVRPGGHVRTLLCLGVSGTLCLDLSTFISRTLSAMSTFAFLTIFLFRRPGSQILTGRVK